MARDPTTAEVLALLTQNPEQIAALTSNLTPARLQTAPSADQWSFNDILAHLRACADMWGQAITTILAEDHPTIRATNPTTWLRQTNYPILEFRSSFRAYTRQRSKLLAVLAPLSAKAWQRSATVTGAGATLTRSVYFYAQWLATHERSHVKHIARLAKTLTN